MSKQQILLGNVSLNATPFSSGAEEKIDFIKCFECLRDLASQMHQSKEKPYILVNTFEKLFPIPENEIVTRVTLSAGDSPEIWDGSLSPYAIKIDIRCSQNQNKERCQLQCLSPSSLMKSIIFTQPNFLAFSYKCHFSTFFKRILNLQSEASGHKWAFDTVSSIEKSLNI